jgi:peroxiredoxin
MEIKTSRLADVAVIIACVAVVTHVGLQYRGGARASGAAAVAPPASRAAGILPYKAGEKSPTLDRVAYNSADRTLLMFVKSTCTYCTQSMPFYVKLAEARKRMGGKVRLVAISPDPPEVLANYLSSHGVTVDTQVAVTPLQMQQIRIRGTPTLVLADTRGTIQEAWMGRLPPENEPAVLKALLGS